MHKCVCVCVYATPMRKYHTLQCTGVCVCYSTTHSNAQVCVCATVPHTPMHKCVCMVLECASVCVCGTGVRKLRPPWCQCTHKSLQHTSHCKTLVTARQPTARHKSQQDCARIPFNECSTSYVTQQAKGTQTTRHGCVVRQQDMGVS